MWLPAKADRLQTNAFEEHPLSKCGKGEWPGNKMAMGWDFSVFRPVGKPVHISKAYSTRKFLNPCPPNLLHYPQANFTSEDPEKHTNSGVAPGQWLTLQLEVKLVRGEVPRGQYLPPPYLCFLLTFKFHLPALQKREKKPTRFLSH